VALTFDLGLIFETFKFHINWNYI